MEAIILAGGFGTRLRHVVKDVPKPMAPVAGQPFLKYIVEEVIRQGVTRIIMAVHYKKEDIMSYFGNIYSGVPIIYSIEEQPLFTGGAVKMAMVNCKEEYVWIINGDTYFNVPMRHMMDEVTEKDMVAAIAVKEMEDFSRYGKVELDKNGTVVKFHEKCFCKKGWINGGIYVLRRDSLKDYPKRFSLEENFFPILLKDKKLYAFPSNGYFVDIGVPEDYNRAQVHFSKAGKLDA